jgi:hypothetical protein
VAASAAIDAVSAVATLGGDGNGSKLTDATWFESPLHAATPAASAAHNPR